MGQALTMTPIHDRSISRSEPGVDFLSLMVERREMNDGWPEAIRQRGFSFTFLLMFISSAKSLLTHGDPIENDRSDQGRLNI
jgi:hypothetical protein